MILPGYQDLKIHAFLFLNKRKGLPSMLLMGMYPGQFVQDQLQNVLNLSTQAWLFTNSLNSNYTKVQLHLSGLSFAYNGSEPNNDSISDISASITSSGLKNKIGFRGIIATGPREYS